MKVFIFNADIYCYDCGRNIQEQILKEINKFWVCTRCGASYTHKDHSACEQCGTTLIPKRIKDEVDKNNSDEWPDGPYKDGGGEADYPHHCGSGGSCLDAYVLKDGSSKVGCFLENPLTTHGTCYVVGLAIEEIRRDGKMGEIVEMWVNYYGIKV